MKLHAGGCGRGVVVEVMVVWAGVRVWYKCGTDMVGVDKIRS